MNKEQKLKNIVKERYAKIAEQGKAENAASCCGATTPSNKVYNIMMDDYSETSGYVADADLGLGCGLPTEFALIKKGDTVIDLGSGAGNDCFVARHEVGLEGKVIGIDFTPIMIEKARTNAEKLGFNNVEFREGDIDNMPVNNDTADVIVSNCVLNLVPNKEKVIAEIHRVLKPGGHFSISDVVLEGQLPEALKQDAEMYAGCIAGAIQKKDYLKLIEDQGFQNIKIQKEKAISIPEDILEKYLPEEEMHAFNNKGAGIYSITVYAEKAGTQQEKPKLKFSELQNGSTCTPNSGCC
ncbi:ubiquinone/menaquinone biosynthesis C-methylase UbiE [Oceanihabitans sediminis]|uniref:Arsenite methyltransferase n=1 Tax=Oceanihabitans sediminis TaxID=1812012 RepID=A0A368P406_9FLAO|nr:arsenite methyltransferase [Oceanihabitans sediminis]RBP29902.1 ubiquinone/menaquinone biosynthesis C-methylase UbiE [Oceanihabitans sediminis]RCU57238.1 methyltransferase domain-containing protein [Oceanihabitans sediminis]